ncbi:hypothetical protein BDY17DRAFT_50870 [Neohortaea acidophila]|uniref:Uncharacterized protein n=1 Tax=Neohortaea acidophila TaxID=245834 RepID=A0A6A6PHB1_9PEZI|nr:uncharacterized protein BDY17DRAFT_50870 [Neohortaea acidophila]KAF2479166.1 hypothetical protein BDY17DRAFT_50870 [Neohortaea acidophila]
MKQSQLDGHFRGFHGIKAVEYVERYKFKGDSTSYVPSPIGHRATAASHLDGCRLAEQLEPRIRSCEKTQDPRRTHKEIEEIRQATCPRDALERACSHVWHFYDQRVLQPVPGPYIRQHPSRRPTTRLQKQLARRVYRCRMDAEVEGDDHHHRGGAGRLVQLGQYRHQLGAVCRVCT